MDMKLFSGLMITSILIDNFQPSVSMLGLGRKNKKKSQVSHVNDDPIRHEAPDLVVRFTTGPDDPCICSGAFVDSSSSISFVLTTNACADRIKGKERVKASTTFGDFPVIDDVQFMRIGANMKLVRVEGNRYYAFILPRDDDTFQNDTPFADEAKWELEAGNQWKAYRQPPVPRSTVAEYRHGMLIPFQDQRFSYCDSGSPLYFDIVGAGTYKLVGLRNDTDNYINVVSFRNVIKQEIEKSRRSEQTS